MKAVELIENGMPAPDECGLLFDIGDEIEAGLAQAQRANANSRRGQRRAARVLNMPGKSGLDVARELLRIRRDLALVPISGYITDAQRIVARHRVYKPGTVKEIADTLARVLEPAGN
jgi:DNA-binding NarL/FixJ family response regulator